MSGGGVSLRDIYNAVSSLEEKIDKRMEKVEDRIDVLEDFKNRIYGMTAIISLFAAGVATFLWDRITGRS